MMAPYFPDIKSAADNKSPKRTLKPKSPLSIELSENNAELNASSRLLNDLTYKSPEKVKLPSPRLHCKGITIRGENVPNENHSQTVMGRLGSMTQNREKTSFTLFSASSDSRQTAAKELKVPRVERLTLKPLQHSKSESQILTPRRLDERTCLSPKPLVRFNSEAKLLSSSTKNAKIATSLTPRPNRRSVSTGMRRYNSTLALNSRERSVSGGTGSSKTVETEDKNDDVTRDRIFKWLVGATDADDPPEQEIDYQDAPRQTDTAVHIIYDGD